MAVYKATIKGHYGGVLIEPGFHVKTVPPPLGDEPDPSDVATGVWDQIDSAVLAAWPTNMHIDELVLTEQTLPPELGLAGSHTVDSDGLMTGSGDGVPTGLTAILNVHSAYRSRSSRGHIAWPSPKYSSRLAGNEWTSAYMTILATVCDFLNVDIEIGSLTTTRVRSVVYSRKRHLLGEDPWAPDVTSIVANPTIHWLKSRMTSP